MFSFYDHPAKMAPHITRIDAKMTKEIKSGSSKSLSYKDAGVDITKANELVKDITKLAAHTHRPGVIGGIGGFSALFEVPLDRYKRPVLVSSTDGVGTKLKLAIEANCFSGIGIDLVAMCVNDILCQGAEPLYFLDYYATGKLQLEPSRAILTSIAGGCEQANMALAGGETAELPGMYHGDDFDLAGFCVGIVEKDKIINGSKVKVGDPLLAIASSGPHSNGYSLIRRVLATQNIAVNSAFPETSVGRSLLEPTRIYVKAIAALQKNIDVYALAHITGGGLLENVPRVLPENTQAVIDTTTWEWPKIFHWLQEKGNISEKEMYRTFNLGIGMIICVSETHQEEALKILTAAGESAWLVGHIAASDNKEPSVLLRS